MYSISQSQEHNHNFFNFVIEKLLKTYIIGISLERRLMVGQEILVLFIMVRIRALQPRIQPPLAGGLIFGFGPTVRNPQRSCLVRL